MTLLTRKFQSVSTLRRPTTSVAAPIPAPFNIQCSDGGAPRNSYVSDNNYQADDLFTAEVVKLMMMQMGHDLERTEQMRPRMEALLKASFMARTPHGSGIVPPLPAAADGTADSCPDDNACWVQEAEEQLDGYTMMVYSLPTLSQPPSM
jgi:hypothetical protein